MKKTVKPICVILTALLLVAMIPFSGAAATPDVWDGTTVATAYDSGTGTEADPYIIKTAAQLKFLQQEVRGQDADATTAKTMEGVFFKLGADIDLGKHEWDPIGTVNFRIAKSGAGNRNFSGTFDGAGHKIINLYISGKVVADATKKYDRCGLFGMCTDAVIKNIHIVGAEVIEDELGAYGSILCGNIEGNNAVISGCTIDSTSKLTMDTSSGTTNSRAGAIAGSVMKGAKVEYCVNNGQVIGKFQQSLFLGGLVGVLGDTKATLDHCINNGPVSSTWIENAASAKGNTGIGGLVGSLGAGSASSDIVISECYNNGSIIAPPQTGGLVGITLYGSCNVTNSHNLSTDISGQNGFTGTLIGFNKSVITVSGCTTVAVGTLGFAGSDDTNKAVTDGGATVKTEAEVKALTDVIKSAIEAKLVYAVDDNPSTGSFPTVAVCVVCATVSIVGIAVLVSKKTAFVK